MVKKLLAILCLVFATALLPAQDTTALQVFNIKKKEQLPIPLGWIGADSCQTGQLYLLNAGKVTYDSIAVYKMQYSIMPGIDCERQYLVWKNEEGKGYVVIWTRRKDGVWQQTYIKPLYFYNKPTNPATRLK